MRSSPTFTALLLVFACFLVPCFFAVEHHVTQRCTTEIIVTPDWCNQSLTIAEPETLTFDIPEDGLLPAGGCQLYFYGSAPNKGVYMQLRITARFLHYQVSFDPETPPKYSSQYSSVAFLKGALWLSNKQPSEYDLRSREGPIRKGTLEIKVAPFLVECPKEPIVFDAPKGRVDVPVIAGDCHLEVWIKPKNVPLTSSLELNLPFDSNSQQLPVQLWNGLWSHHLHYNSKPQSLRTQFPWIMMHVPSAGRLSSLNNQYRNWISTISGESKAWTVQTRNVYPTFNYDVIPSQTNRTTWCLRFYPYVSGSSMGREWYSREQEVEQGVKTKAIARNTWQKEAQDKTPKLNVTIYSNVKAPLPADRFDLASLQLTFFESDLTAAPS
ncbi:hypothetical protein QOT17_011282, partial [Balamuthia mandrillaris]